MDMIAPYRGIAPGMVRFVMTRGQFTQSDFYFRRVTGDNVTRRIVHVDFQRDDLARVLQDDDFLGGARPDD
jgi:cytolysin-activating lysine-acyltransferase